MSLSHLHTTIGIQKSVVDEVRKAERMMVELRVLRPDLTSDLIKAECVKIAAIANDKPYSIPILNTLKSCIYKAQAGEPMPWETQD